MICIIDYELGNVISVKNAIDKLGYACKISRDFKDISIAQGIILPGVGSFEKGMVNLKKYRLIDILKNEVIMKRKKFLGICLGLQLICETSEEFGNHVGLSWVNANVKKIASNKQRLPHVGWNKIKILKENPLFNGISNETMFYFNHSFCIYKNKNQNYDILSECDYGNNFVAAIQNKNIFGIQPHPEKSQNQGLKVLDNFCKLKI